MSEGTLSSWQVALVRANRFYALGALLATSIGYFAPHVLGAFVPCAVYMQVDWFAVPVVSLAGAGLASILASLLALAEGVLPRWSIAPTRVLVLWVMPIAIFIGAVWLSLEPFWPSLMDNPDVLCG